MTNEIDAQSPATLSEAPGPQFKPVQVLRAADDIARQIRQEITSGRLLPGAKLPAERALAAELGVSRNTLREAVRSLEQAGLVQLKKGAHGGIFITGNNGASVAIVSGLLDLYRLGGIAPRHLTQARIWVEAIVIREACQRATASDIAALNANIDAAVAAAESGEFETKVALNHEFHRILARMTDNPIMIAFINGLIEVLVEFVIRIGPHDTSYIFPSRRRFMAHFERGDAEAAIQEMTSVLEQFQEAYFPKEMGG